MWGRVSNMAGTTVLSWNLILHVPKLPQGSIKNVVLYTSLDWLRAISKATVSSPTIFSVLEKKIIVCKIYNHKFIRFCKYNQDNKIWWNCSSTSMSLSVSLVGRLLHRNSLKGWIAKEKNINQLCKLDIQGLVLIFANSNIKPFGKVYYGRTKLIVWVWWPEALWPRALKAENTIHTVKE